MLALWHFFTIATICIGEVSWSYRNIFNIHPYITEIKLPNLPNLSTGDIYIYIYINYNIMKALMHVH